MNSCTVNGNRASVNCNAISIKGAKHIHDSKHSRWPRSTNATTIIMGELQSETRAAYLLTEGNDVTRSRWAACGLLVGMANSGSNSRLEKGQYESLLVAAGNKVKWLGGGGSRLGTEYDRWSWDDRGGREGRWAGLGPKRDRGREELGGGLMLEQRDLAAHRRGEAGCSEL